MTVKYTPATFSKAIMGGVVAAIGAATAAAGGADLSVLDWPQILGAVGAGLVAFGGVFVTPNKDHHPPVSPADQVIAALPTVVEQANQAVSELDRVRQAATDALGQVPVVGPLAQAAIDSVLAASKLR